MSGVKLGGRESDLTIPECGLAIMIMKPLPPVHRSFYYRFIEDTDTYHPLDTPIRIRRNLPIRITIKYVPYLRF